MFVTRHNSVVERGLLERLWDLYELAYRRTAEESATREMLFRSEFDSAVADSRNRLWVLWADAEPVAMVLIATDIGATRYLSQPFFERHFTDHARRGAVHYILFVVVHPRYAAKGALTRMARDVLGTEAAEVLPYLWMFTGTFEAGILRLSATASRMRTFAWWNRK